MKHDHDKQGIETRSHGQSETDNSRVKDDPKLQDGDSHNLGHGGFCQTNIVVVIVLRFIVARLLEDGGSRRDRSSGSLNIIGKGRG